MPSCGTHGALTSVSHMPSPRPRPSSVQASTSWTAMPASARRRGQASLRRPAHQPSRPATIGMAMRSISVM